MPKKKIHISRFTPSLMNNQTLESIFVQRESLVVDSLKRIQASANGARHYMLFAGPRGCGKTHFVSVFANRLRALPEHDEKFFIVWLNEDKTSRSLLDLNIKVYEKLCEHYSNSFSLDDIDHIYDLARKEATIEICRILETKLADRFVVLIMENLDTLFDSLKSKGRSEWKSNLEKSGRFSVLATAQQLFPGVTDESEPFFGFFHSTHFEPLTLAESRQLLKKIAIQQEDQELAKFLETPAGRSRVQILHHLSGGNHRVCVVFSEFISRNKLDNELVVAFTETLDELTPYYQERLRWLSPQQREIVEFLCSSERAQPVKAISRALFSTNQTISKQLKELKEKRYVRSAKKGRDSLYELTEPLMRMAMELKENRGRPIRLIIDFLRVWFSRQEISVRLIRLNGRDYIEREYLESAIETIDASDDSLRVRAMLSMIDWHYDDEERLIELAQEVTETHGLPDSGVVSRAAWEKFESRFPSLRCGLPFEGQVPPPQFVFRVAPAELVKKPPVVEGPAPPVPGTEATLEMGFDQRDLDVLDEVGNYRFGTIIDSLPMCLPSLNFRGAPGDSESEEEHMIEVIKGIKGSISLSIQEKHALVASLPRWSDAQRSELLKILAEERLTFSELPPKHLSQLQRLERHHAFAWCDWLVKMTGSAEARNWINEFDRQVVLEIKLETPKELLDTAVGPAPPPVGDHKLDLSSFDDEDMKTLAVVHDYRFRSISNQFVDPKILETIATKHSLKPEFVKLVAGSISLSAIEKSRIFECASSLRPGQFEGLELILSRETDRFQSLSPKHLEQLRKLESRHTLKFINWAIEKFDLDPEFARALNEKICSDLILSYESCCEFDSFRAFEKSQRLVEVVDALVNDGREADAEIWMGKLTEFLFDNAEEHQAAEIYNSAKPLIKAKKFGDLLRVAKRRSESYPHDLENNRLIGYCHEKLEQFEQALKVFGKLIDSDDSKKSDLYNRAVSCFHLRLFEQAAHDCEELISKDSNDFHALSLLSSCLRELGDFQRSLEALDKAESCESGQNRIWILKSKAKTLSLSGNLVDAVEILLLASTSDQHGAELLNSAAYHLYKAGMNDAASLQIRESLRLDPDCPNANFTKAEILLASGDWESGWKQFDSSLSRFPAADFQLEAEQDVLEIIFSANEDRWLANIKKLCAIFEKHDSIPYLGTGLVNSLLKLKDEEAGKLNRWSQAWASITEFDNLELSVRMFATGIEFLIEKNSSVLLGVPFEQRAILQQVFGIDLSEKFQTR